LDRGIDALDYKPGLTMPVTRWYGPVQHSAATYGRRYLPELSRMRAFLSGAGIPG